MDSDEVARLLSLVSHELRSPLGVVRGYLRLLEQQGAALADPHRQSVAAALRASHRLAELLAQVSALAALERKETTLDLTTVAVDDLLQAAIDAVPLPDDRVIQLQLVAPPSVDVVADRAMLQAALTGLMSSVVRAQPSDTTVSVSARTTQVDGVDGVTLEISTPESDPASVAEGALDISRGGLGLELPIAAALIDAHGGRIRERRDGSRTAGVVVWLPGGTVGAE